MEKSLRMNGRADTVAVNRKFSSRMQARLLLVFCLVALFLIGLMGRLIYLTQTDGDRYAKHVLSRQSYVSSVLPYKRGDILDRNGTVLARSELQYRLILDPKLLLENKDYVDPTLAVLKANFGFKLADLKDILKERADSQYVILQKNIKYDTVEAYKEKTKDNTKIRGVWFEEEYVRSYPNDALACDVIGFTSVDNKGYYGIEEYYNKELNGTNGREYGYYDASLNIERIVEKPQNGNTVVSTIDAEVQRILQKNIVNFNTEFGSKNIGILVMNPNNGEILGMASNQEYDLNDPRNLEVLYTKDQITAMSDEEKTNALNELWKNDVISYNYEPGSTFKPFTVAAALEENLVSDGDTFYCDGGEDFGPTHIRCSNVNGHGTLTLGETLMKSCNDAMMQIAAKEGRKIFYNYQNSFGFGRKTGLDLPGEETGLLISVDNLNGTELATSSFGQSMNATMIQMAAAYSSLVNGGYYYQPHVVKQIVNDSGATVKQIDKILVRQTVSAQTSKLIQEYMYKTVEEGTAKPAKVEGYAIGGKTGTAQKYPRDARTYLVSFLGAVPAINPQAVIYIIVDEAQNVTRQDDSTIATKLASKVMKEILPVLGIYPEGDIDYLLEKDDTDKTAEDRGTASNGGADGQGQGVNAGSENGVSQEGNTPEDTNDNASQNNSDTQNNNDTRNSSDAQGDSGNSDTQTGGEGSGNQKNNSSEQTKNPGGTNTQGEAGDSPDSPAGENDPSQGEPGDASQGGAGSAGDDFNAAAIE